VITLILKGNAFQFEGRCQGIIAEAKSGVQGFGYDPIFIPEGAAITFAEYSADEKNAISHRRKAFDALSDYVRSLNSKTR
jgi:XTP/dITP diphosphohydrolase